MKDCPHKEEGQGTADPEHSSLSQLLTALTHTTKRKKFPNCVMQI